MVKKLTTPHTSIDKGLFLGWLKLFWRRNFVLICFFILTGLGFLFYLYFNSKPFTNNAFLVANVRPVSAFVPGYVTHIYVANNQRVKKGTKLLQLFKTPYELEVKRLENEISALTARLIGADNEIIKAKHLVAKSQAAVNNALYLANQATKLANVKAVAEKVAEQRQQELNECRAQLKASRASLAIAKANHDALSANKKSLSNQLGNAKVNLAETTIYAKSDGTVTNLFIGAGTYLKQGDPICAFVETDKWWVQANFKETDLSMVKGDMKAKVRLWIYPGKHFTGVVENSSWSVNRQRSALGNNLQEVEKENEWFLLPQRLPVMIRLDNADSAKYPFHTGASASVQIDAPNPVLKVIYWLFKNNT